jgi:hypothetical protein
MRKTNQGNGKIPFIPGKKAGQTGISGEAGMCCGRADPRSVSQKLEKWLANFRERLDNLSRKAQNKKKTVRQGGRIRWAW